MTLPVPLVGCVAALLLATASAAAADAQHPTPTPPVNLIEGLQTALAAEHGTKEDAGDVDEQRRLGRTTATASYLAMVREALVRGDDETALSYVAQMRIAAGSDELRKACDVFTEQVSRYKAEKREAFESAVDAAIKHAREIIPSAKEPSELDAVIEEFHRLTETNAANMQNGRSAVSTKLQGAYTFVERWQDYLFALGRNDTAAAAGDLRNLVAGSGYNLTILMPRSEVLARMPANFGANGETLPRPERHPAEINAAVAEILGETHTLDDIPVALNKLNDLASKTSSNQSYNDNSTDLGAAISGLQSLQKTYSELRAGLATTVTLASIRSENNSRSPVEGDLAGLRSEVVKLALPRLLNLPDAKPAAGESVITFLRRLIDLAKAREDWASVVRGLEIQRAFATGQNNYSAANNQEMEGFKAFFTGLNMEAASQYEQAVIAYLNALKSGVQELPASLIGEHLAAIQKAHPKEFADANTYVLSPPVPQYGDDPYRPGGRYDPRFTSRRGYPPGGPEQSTPAPFINVPAASPVTASPKPAPAAVTPSPTAAR